MKIIINYLIKLNKNKKILMKYWNNQNSRNLVKFSNSKQKYKIINS